MTNTPLLNCENLDVIQKNKLYLFKLGQQDELYEHEIKLCVRRIYSELEHIAEVFHTGPYDNYYSESKNNLQQFMEDRCFSSKGESLYEVLSNFLQFRLERNVMYFSIGKYKGRIVQDVIDEDIDYCKWFAGNVIGRDFDTLKIIDYIYKKLNDVPYRDKNPKLVLQDILDDYIPKEWKKIIDRDAIISRVDGYRGGKSSGYDFVGDDYDSWEYDVYDYGDFC